jgi:HlyD family secretion protein
MGVARAAGVVDHQNPPNRPGGRQSPQIEPGATVRERQVLFYLPDLSRPLRVNTKVHESIVDRLRPGLRARVEVDAFPGQTFSGVVEAVAHQPDPTTFLNPGLKVYTTRVAIEGGSPNLRPGMTARVEILISELDNVLSVPVVAVVRYDDKDRVAVKTPDGGVDWREVTLGRSNEKMVEVKAGLKAGESVAIDAASLLSDDQKRRAALSPTEPAGAFKAAIPPRAKSKAADLRIKLQSVDPEERAKLRGASSEERRAILRKAGFSDDEIEQVSQLPSPADPR